MLQHFLDNVIRKRLQFILDIGCMYVYVVNYPLRTPPLPWIGKFGLV